MREILFRGKRIDNGEWVYGNFCMDALEQIRGLCGLDGFIRRFNLNAAHIEMHEVDRETVGQYTGLVDKNGKQIFEGDILRYKNCDDEYGFLFVEFRNGNFCVNEQGVTCDPVSEVLCLGVEVIGNIHDDPELLKEA